MGPATEAEACSSPSITPYMTYVWYGNIRLHETVSSTSYHLMCRTILANVSYHTVPYLASRPPTEDIMKSHRQTAGPAVQQRNTERGRISLARDLRPGTNRPRPPQHYHSPTFQRSRSKPPTIFYQTIPQLLTFKPQ